MAHLNKNTGRIDLSVDDEEMFREVKDCATNQKGPKTPIANRIIHAIHTGKILEHLDWTEDMRHEAYQANAN